MRRRMLAGAALIAAAVAMSGCSASKPGPSVDLPAKDEAKWVMPLEQFHDEGIVSAGDAAENTLVSVCLGKLGVDWPVSTASLDRDRQNPQLQSLSYGAALDPATAATWGYRAPRDATAQAAQAKSQADFTKTNAIAAATPGFDTMFSPCLAEARKQLPTLSRQSYGNRFIGYVNQARDAATREPAVRAAAKKWHDCLSSAGYASVPADPFGDILNANLAKQAGIPRQGGGDGAPRPPLTKQEISLAVTDAQCRASTGWAHAEYEAEWNQQVKILDENADVLVRGRDADAAAMKQFLAVIAAHPAQQ